MRREYATLNRFFRSIRTSRRPSASVNFLGRLLPLFLACGIGLRDVEFLNSYSLPRAFFYHLSDNELEHFKQLFSYNTINQQWTKKITFAFSGTVHYLVLGSKAKFRFRWALLIFHQMELHREFSKMSDDYFLKKSNDDMENGIQFQ